MEFVFHTERLSYVKAYFLAAAEVMAGMLGSPFAFHAKLNALTVHVYEDRQHPSCFYLEDNSNRCVIDLHVGLPTLNTDTLLIIAHELAHMLMSNMGLGRNMTLADGSRMSYSIVHRNDKDGRSFGLGLEEALATLISIEVARRAAGRLDITPRSINYAIRQEEEMHKLLLQAAAAFARCFGKPLSRLTTLDSMRPVGKCAAFFNPNDDNLCTAEAANNIDNLFWCFLSNGSFPEIACRYNELMGDGAYAALCRNFDTMYLSAHDRVTYTDEEQLLLTLLGNCSDTPQKRMHDSIMDSIEQFRKRMADTDRRISTLPIANESLREVIRHMRRRLKAATTHPVEDGDGCPSPLREELQAISKQLHLGSPMKSLLRAAALFRPIDTAYGSANTPYAIHLSAIRQMLTCATEVIEHYKPALAQEILGTD